MRPPASCGDILAATLSGVAVIGLIDGVFENSASVWHKEILFALSAGVRVFGSSSMGALRAAECAEFGMVGVGAVFEDYFSGVREADADVAVIHAPAELAFQPITLALVDAEETLRRALDKSLLNVLAYDRLLAAARAVHFSQRTWEEVVVNANLDACSMAFASATIERCRYSVKQADAKLLLAHVCRALLGSSGDQENSRPFERTAFFELLKRRISMAARDSAVV